MFVDGRKKITGEPGDIIIMFIKSLKEMQKTNIPIDEGNIITISLILKKPCFKDGLFLPFELIWHVLFSRVLESEEQSLMINSFKYISDG